MYNVFCVDLAELMELADMQDLGSCGRPCGFESHIPHSYYYHRKENEERAYHVGNNGYNWSRTSNSSTNAYNVNTSNVNPSNNNRYNGCPSAGAVRLEPIFEEASLITARLKLVFFSKNSLYSTQKML